MVVGEFLEKNCQKVKYANLADMIAGRMEEEALRALTSICEGLSKNGYVAGSDRWICLSMHKYYVLYVVVWGISRTSHHPLVFAMRLTRQSVFMHTNISNT